MSNTRAEWRINCNYCARPLSVAHFAQTIRCHQCNKLNLIDEKNKLSSPSNGSTGRRACGEKNDTKGVQLHNPFRKIRCNDNSPKANSPNKGPNLAMESINEWKVTPGKRALLCGVAYNNQKFKLKGTINDVDKMKILLEHNFQFPPSSIHMLVEDRPGYHSPTKKNIREALKWLVKDLKSGDSLVFYFSGHGLRQPDFENDEIDGFDETICPVDFKTEGMILDNEINQTIVRPLTKGVKLHAIVDACHSGTILDLPYVFDIKDNKWKDNRPPSLVEKGTNGGLAISFSACGDDQLATDTIAFTEEMAGAMTYTFRKAIENTPHITYLRLLTSMTKDIKEANDGRCFSRLREIFKRKILQEPLLSSSDDKFDVNTEFML